MTRTRFELTIEVISIPDQPLYPKSDATTFEAYANPPVEPIAPDLTETSSISDQDPVELTIETIPIPDQPLYPKSDATTFEAYANPPVEPIAPDLTVTSSISDHDSVDRAIDAISIPDQPLYSKSDATSIFEASANSPLEPISSDPAESSSPSDDDPIELALKALQIAWARRSKAPK